MSSLSDNSVLVPETSESEDESKNQNIDLSMVDDVQVLSMNTPPRKSILRPSGVLTPASERKRVKFSERKSLSLNITPACSPAYFDRDSIAKEDMANATFFLEKSQSSTFESPSGGKRSATTRGTGISTIDKEKSSPTANTSRNCFEITNYIKNMMSPLKKSFSASHLNKIGLQSTPLSFGSPTRQCRDRNLLRSPRTGVQNRGNFFANSPIAMPSPLAK